jgi:hypothetical protein
MSGGTGFNERERRPGRERVAGCGLKRATYDNQKSWKVVLWRYTSAFSVCVWRVKPGLWRWTVYRGDCRREDHFVVARGGDCPTRIEAQDAAWLASWRAVAPEAQ